jgi:hypothetical protein
MSETHTAPSLVSDRISRIENIETRSPPRIPSSDRLGKKEFDTIKTSVESPIITTPQTSIDIRIRNQQIISSIDSDLSGPTQPIYQSTPKTIKQKYDEDAGHESEDELSDPKQIHDTRRRTSKSRLRDFSQSISQPMDTTNNILRTISKFNETNMENVLSHVPPSKGLFISFNIYPNFSLLYR